MFGYSSRIEWESFTDLERTIIESLPHGSGIDYDWDCWKQQNGKVVCVNAYHGMNEGGYYIGSVDFSFRFDVRDVESGRIMFHGLNSTGKRWVETWGLRDYFAEMFFGLLNENITRPCKYCEGTGKRDICAMAAIRNQSIEETVKAIQENKYTHHNIDLENMTVCCWVCRGTGRLPVKN